MPNWRGWLRPHFQIKHAGQRRVGQLDLPNAGNRPHQHSCGTDRGASYRDPPATEKP